MSPFCRGGRRVRSNVARPVTPGRDGTPDRHRNFSVEAEVFPASTSANRVAPAKIERLAAAMGARLHDAIDLQVRRRYVRAFVGEVVMSREGIVIRGPSRSL